MDTEFVATPPLVTCDDVEYPQALGRRIKLGLTLVGAAAATVATLAIAPAATADPSTVVIPDFPSTTGDRIAPENLGILPYFAGEAYQQNGHYTDSLGVAVDTAGLQAPNGPLEINDYEVSSLEAVSYVTPGSVASVTGAATDGTIFGSTFSAIITGSGIYNLFEDTPFLTTGATSLVQNVNDIWLYDPAGLPFSDLSGVEFGIQYLDLPDAATGPVDQLNVLGAGGEILFSIPVTGDLLTLF